MSNITTQQTGALAAGSTDSRMAVADIIQHVKTVQEVMRAVMKENVHFGVIPGTDKPTLLKPGAEVLCMTFRIADSYHVEDLSADGLVRYRVTCTGTHQMSGLVLGAGMGEASSGEEKYKWRKAWPEEFEAAPENMKRVKMGKYKAQQIRTEPADLANTILKMANKRAKMAMVLNVTAASDCFTQDLEDMDEALRDQLARDGEGAPPAPPAAPAPPAKPYPDAKFDKMIPVWKEEIEKGEQTVEGLCTFAVQRGQPFSEAQITRLKNAIAVQDVQAKEKPAVVYAELVDKMMKATTADALDELATLISALPADQQAGATAVYDEQKAKVTS